jgi:hypothetical protein
MNNNKNDDLEGLNFNLSLDGSNSMNSQINLQHQEESTAASGGQSLFSGISNILTGANVSDEPNYQSPVGSDMQGYGSEQIQSSDS